MDSLMKCYDELKNTLDLVNKNNDQITTKYNKNVTKYENTLKGESIRLVYNCNHITFIMFNCPNIKY